MHYHQLLPCSCLYKFGQHNAILVHCLCLGGEVNVFARFEVTLSGIKQCAFGWNAISSKVVIEQVFPRAFANEVGALGLSWLGDTYLGISWKLFAPCRLTSRSYGHACILSLLVILDIISLACIIKDEINAFFGFQIRMLSPPPPFLLGLVS